jgi:hypothetical protein
MHVQWKRSCAFVLLAGSAVVLPSACANEDTSIFIRECLAVPTDTCLATPSTTAPFVGVGHIDAAFAARGTYECFALVENQMVPRGDPNTLKTETDGVQLYEANVQVLNTANQVIQYVGSSGPTAAAFSVPISGYVDPATGGTAGLGITEITMINADALQAIGQMAATQATVQEVVVSVVVKGRTLGGFEVHTNTFLFPIQITYATTCFVPSGQTCAGSTTTTTAANCILGQDGATNCQLIAGAFPLCGHLECDVNVNALSTKACATNADCTGQPGATTCNTATHFCGTADTMSAHCPAHIPADQSCCM